MPLRKPREQCSSAFSGRIEHTLAHKKALFFFARRQVVRITVHLLGFQEKAVKVKTEQHPQSAALRQTENRMVLDSRYLCMKVLCGMGKGDYGLLPPSDACNCQNQANETC